MKFFFNQKVKITAGFFRTQEGTIISYEKRLFKKPVYLVLLRTDDAYRTEWVFEKDLEELI